MGSTFTATKLQWFDKFDLGLKQDAKTGAPLLGEQTVGIDLAGDYWNVPVHLTLYRTTWKYKFQPHHDTAVIFDRIFGRGSTGVHVTLETGQQPEPHCYFGGPNFGGSDAEKRLLEEILEFYVNRFSQTIRSLKSRYTSFEFPGSNNPMDRLLVDPSDCFEEMARMATLKHGADVVYPAQADSALLWAAAAVHPLQPLQNTYQRLVRDACRGLDGDKAKAREGEALGKYCYFRASPPKLTGQSAGAEPDTEEQLTSAEKAIDRLKYTLEDFKPDEAERRPNIDRLTWSKASKYTMQLHSFR